MADKKEATPANCTLLQGFEWYVPADGIHYQRLMNVLPQLQAIGVTAVWLPPGCKSCEGPKGNGYDIYDIWDLGEFNQKGGVRTKWGDKEGLVKLADRAKELDIALYWDAVMNHKAGADWTETGKVVEVDEDDRTKAMSEPFEIEAWVGFDFKGRDGKYSKQQYHWEHFNGTDFDQRTGKKTIMRFEPPGWSEDVSKQWGNGDFLLFANLYHKHPEVAEDFKRWGEWIVNEVKLSGFRIDAAQHFSQNFTSDWIAHLETVYGKEKLFYVGEYWWEDVVPMIEWLDTVGHKFSLFDSVLVYHFHETFKQEKGDLRNLFKDTLVEKRPTQAVTLVMNHDTQPGQRVQLEIDDSFRPLAYSLVLLRRDGYASVFWGDLYGRKGDDAEGPACKGKLPEMMKARKLYAYGEQEDYFNAPNCIGFVRRGTWDRPWGLACVMSNAEQNEKPMNVGDMHRGEEWTDILGFNDAVVTIDEKGFGMFPCAPMSASVYVSRKADGRADKIEFDTSVY